MNEIERAIEYLEPISKHPTMTGEYCEHIKTALAALCEQAEREKGCESCDGGWGDNTVEFMCLDYTVCPYCGRQLEVEE